MVDGWILSYASIDNLLVQFRTHPDISLISDNILKKATKGKVSRSKLVIWIVWVDNKRNPQIVLIGVVSFMGHLQKLCCFLHAV